MAVIQDKVRGLIVDLEGETLLVPNVAIAEVLPFVQPEAAEDGPEWLMGYCDWRGHRLPVVSVEVVHGHAAPAIDKDTRIAVLNTVKGKDGVPFYAILTRGIPHLVKLSEDDIGLSGGASAKGELARVLVNNQQAIIPDLAKLEGLVKKVA